MRDQLFQGQAPGLESFQFNAPVAEVFDDMVRRSVPHYDAIQELLVQFALRRAQGHAIYDLGCSTGSTLLRLAGAAKAPLTLVGVDNSQPMLELCRQKLAGALGNHVIHLESHDLEESLPFHHGPAGAVILCLVLQFLRPRRRLALLQLVHQQIVSGGCLLVVEKTVQRQPELNSLFIELHHEFKAGSGYSQSEIARKREALENRLIPFRPEENLEMLVEAGFPEPSVFFSALNFQGYIALKT